MNDRQRAVTWAREHWHVAIFVCACLPVIAAVLAWFGVLSERAAWIAIAVSVIYVLVLTWWYTRQPSVKRPPVERA